ncbi:hypothetical protein BWQ96_07931 [Gracilariopsis chorda]|uniref:Uncharacterized protein n=1 Tax=Gracilariopsis chorda TaxID=448386 RepID=A0A2V3IJU0_9FLOR|nr:hypothetical protein BWQ96_07931 [Gracilariopsis chorda]|eukprot:PXF42342.1 hypothetical protein BWQ96_07931 [Gracilariopsis chorda]
MKGHVLHANENMEGKQAFVFRKGKCYRCGKLAYKMDKCWEHPDSEYYLGNRGYKKKHGKKNRGVRRDDDGTAGLVLCAHDSEAQNDSSHEEAQRMAARYQPPFGANHKLYLDPGVSVHIPNSFQSFDGEIMRPKKTKISVGSGEALDVQDMGRAQCKMVAKKRKSE